MDNNLEEWKQIEDFPMYEVSTEGRIKSHYSGKILKPQSNWNGYLMVNLYKDGKMTSKRIHRLVAIAFIPNPDNLPCIDHISGCKTNNRASNLRWCTKKENANYKNHKPMSEEQKARLREYQNRDKQKEYHKLYSETHKEQMLEYQKQYYQLHKEQKKLYYQQNKEQILDKMKQKYQQNKSNKSNKI